MDDSAPLGWENERIYPSSAGTPGPAASWSTACPPRYATPWPPSPATDRSRGRALLEPQLAALFRDRLSAHDRDRLEYFAAQRARHPVGEGLSATVAALQRGRADALVVNHPAEEWPPLWTGTAPDQIAPSATDLQIFGATGYEPADAALLYAAVTAGAELIVVAREETPLPGGDAFGGRDRRAPALPSGLNAAD
ncbi:hypothetical protein ACFWBS_43005 [Streptomyces mirabilis]|uniref:hypothetical protein n=1 Tax=Streptomyces TaxID=1883 RepID=UPI000BE25252|nr:hypothetical protein [Streptomyces sp. OK228]